MIGPRPNLLGHEAGSHYRLEVAQPILTDGDLKKIHAIETLVAAFRTDTLDATWPATESAEGMAPALDRLCREATEAVLAGHNILILSDRALSAERVPIPALLATSAVHHHLIRQGLRTSTGIVVETGEAREVHHFCALAGYGAEAINPYLAFATLEQIRVENDLPLSAHEVQKNYIKGVGKGILKVISKMGIWGSRPTSLIAAHKSLTPSVWRATSSRNISLERLRQSKVSVCARSRKKRLKGTETPTATTRSIRICSMSAAITPFACAARTTPGRRSRWQSCSTRCAATHKPITGALPRRSTTRASAC
jgi:hypothetical protein